ncbi:MAG: tetratricopeptide repeat protein [Rikenellaceae bacterium]|nr:tetratricopeptide repeat protein [Rikenellaceae bacterium]
MKRTIYLMVMLIAALTLAIPAQAQKWPERSRVRRGNRAYERLDYGRAEERYQQALELSDTCFEAKFNLGDALYKQQRYDEAEKIFTALAADSTRSDLDRAHSFYNLGNSLFQQKKYQEALSAFKRSLRLNPADLETKYNYAYTKKYIEDNQQGGGGGDNNQNQDNQNQDQNQQGDGQNDQQNDQDQNQQGNDDQNMDQNQDNENNNDQKDQNSDNNENQSDQNQNDQYRDGDGENDDQQGDNDRDQQGNDDPNEGDQDPNEQGGGQNEPQPSGLSQNDAERMLDAIQGEEDKTRDKVNAKVGQGVVRSGKNW